MHSSVMIALTESRRPRMDNHKRSPMPTKNSSVDQAQWAQRVLAQKLLPNIYAQADDSDHLWLMIVARVSQLLDEPARPRRRRHL